MSVPSANGTTSSAVTTADPPDDPPATRVSSAAFLVGPNAEFSVEPPCAKASKFALPMQIAPSASNFSTAVACSGALKFSSIFEAAVVGAPNAKKLSFTTNGTPANRPETSPASTFSARSSARFSVKLSSALYSSISRARRNASFTFSTALLPIKSLILLITIPAELSLGYSVFLAPNRATPQQESPPELHPRARHCSVP